MAIEARPAPADAVLGRLTSPVLVGRERELGQLTHAAVHPHDYMERPAQPTRRKENSP